MGHAGPVLRGGERGGRPGPPTPKGPPIRCVLCTGGLTSRRIDIGWADKKDCAGNAYLVPCLPCRDPLLWQN